MPIAEILKVQELISDLRSEYLSAHQELLKNIIQFQSLLKEVDLELFDFPQNKLLKNSKTKIDTSKDSISHTESKKSQKSGLVCPRCKKGEILKRTNSLTKESFYGCSTYPTCKYTSPISKTVSIKQKKPRTDKTTKKEFVSISTDQKSEKCPLCKSGNQLIRTNKKTGNKFYGCTNYPSCKWTKSIS